MLQIIRNPALVCAQRTVLSSAGIRKSCDIFIRCRSDELFNLIGGGLEKLQGGLKEEQYFQNRNNELLVKWRQELSSIKDDSPLKNDQVTEASNDKSAIEMTASEWNQINKRLKSKMHRSVLQESCFLSKHKNCQEELYFYNEQCECIRRFKDQNLGDKKKHQNN